MKKRWMVVTMMMVGLCASGERAAAQGPAGAGAGSAAGTSLHAPHSYNPMKWVKKDPKTGGDSLNANGDREKKLTTMLQGQGVLAASANIADACATFKELSDCVAALHASHNLALDFNCVKSDMTGVQTGADMSSCKGQKGDKGVELSKAIHLLKPDANAKAEAKNAEKQAKEDLKEFGA
jgi:hypothetical protein